MSHLHKNKTKQNLIQNKVDYIFKIILVGPQNVGKSSILNRFVDNTYSNDYITTIGVDFKIKSLNIEDKVVKLQIWDTCGQERFGALTSTHFKGAHGCLCVYDITNEKSFEDCIKYLITAVDQYKISGKQCYIIGNKIDLEKMRVINQDKGLQLATKYSAYFCETSAKTNININQIFYTLAESLMKKLGSMDDLKQSSQQKQLKSYGKKININSCC